MRHIVDRFRNCTLLTPVAVAIIASGITWGFLFCPVAVVLPLVITLPGLWSGAIGGLVQGAALRLRIPLVLKHWVILNSVAWGGGLLIASLILGLDPPLYWETCRNDSVCPGWNAYMAPIVGMAGLCVGLAQWLYLRRFVKWSGWIVAPALVAGFVVGAYLGWQMDHMIVEFGMTSNRLGERLAAAAMVGLPVGFAAFGIVIGSSLALVLIQYDWQQRNHRVGQL